MKIILNSICKSYAGKEVIRDLSFTFEEGKPVVIEGVSGIGKTTLLRIIMGLEKPDSGEVLFEEVQQEKVRFAPVFQEIRLIESLDAVSNVKLAAHGVSTERIEEELKSLIPEDELHKKVCDLSGGTRRRVEIVRAVMSPSDVLIMDEPLTGLDDDNAEKAVSYIMDNIGGRLFIAASHSRILRSGTVTRFRL
ncbi:MAG: ATP-binding cassette domain-containing protein [Clostridiales bacterium]|nr:ATP-binding cassette domain-containing protein [Clostridiales bacterium]